MFALAPLPDPLTFVIGTSLYVSVPPVGVYKLPPVIFALSNPDAMPNLVSVTLPCALPSALFTIVPTNPSVIDVLEISSGFGFAYVNVVLVGVLITTVFSSSVANVLLSPTTTLIALPICKL